jgi:hypothetical protein
VKTDLLRRCSLPPHPQPIERHEIPLRRMGRFFGEQGTGGIYEAFVRRGDELVSLNDVADWLVAAVSGLGREAVVTRFRLGVQYGEFGRGPLGKIARLIDLDDFRKAAPGCYALRPMTTRAMESPSNMRARGSTWAKWLQGQGWPVPGWLAGAPTIEDEATVMETSAIAAPTLPVPDKGHPRGRGPKAVERERVERDMRAIDPDVLGKMKLSEMAAAFHSSEATCRRARFVISSISRKNLKQQET